ncbi:ParA family protein [Chitinivorax sp. PXF-14]|uniref:ParA family protein n=1 Tax=Chitinivorax sp. PXF-14 TaxID=3230488 RepID=UPI0034670992
MRTFEVRAKLASELLAVPLDANEIRALANKENVPRSGYHLTYSAADIGQMRSKLFPEFNERLKLPTVPPVVSLRMSKGGVGKSTTASNLALCVAAQGYRALLIDADPQGDASDMLGIDVEQEGIVTMLDLLTNNAPIESAIQRPYAEMALSVIPADNFLSSFDLTVSAYTRREYLFATFIKNNSEFLAKNFDIIIVDSPPSSSVLNFNVLVASDVVLSVVKLDGMSTKALRVLAQELNDLDKAFSMKKPVLFLANGYHPSYRSSEENLDNLKNMYGDQLLKTVIPAYAGFLSQSRVTKGETNALYEREPTSPAGRKLLELSREILALLGIKGLGVEQ